MADTDASQLLATFLPASRRAAFVGRFGVCLSDVDEWVLAAYGDDRVHGLRGVDALRLASADLADEPGTPIGAGRVSGAAISRAALGDRTLIARERGPAATIVTAIRRGRADPALTGLRTPPSPVALRVLVPGRLPLPVSSDLARVLTGQRGARIHVGVAGHGTVTLSATLFGDFPESIDRNLRTAVASMAGEPFGAAMGLPAALPGLVVGSRPGAVTLRLSLSALRLRHALRPLTETNPWTLLF